MHATAVELFAALFQQLALLRLFLDSHRKLVGSIQVLIATFELLDDLLENPAPALAAHLNSILPALLKIAGALSVPTVEIDTP